MQPLRKVKIIATVGPASQSPEILKQLIKAGVNVFRLNLSHGDHAFHRNTFESIRALEKELNQHIGILMDLQGPKLRVDTFENKSVTLQQGQIFTLDQQSVPGNMHRVHLPHPELFTCLKPDHLLLLDDGKIVLKVITMWADHLETEVMVGGTLSDHKGLNVPNIHLPIPALTTKDKEDALFAATLGADFLAISFVQTAHDVEELRTLIQGKIPIISKIEKPQAIVHLDEIIQASDGIMVARGDLGVELSPEEVPGLQKKIIRLANQYGKPVMVATQMLESMITAPSPTRAEASDVATAVFDGADCVMLSAESAMGKHPLEAVKMMNKIIHCAENDPLYPSFLKAIECGYGVSHEDAITNAARTLIYELKAKALGVFSAQGTTILSAANKRPLVPIFGIVQQESLARQLTLAWGVYPLLVDQFLDFKKMALEITASIHQFGFTQSGDKIVFTGSIPLGQPGTTNLLSIETIS